MEMSDILDYEAIERQYDEYDHERETFMEDGNDEPPEEVEPDDLDDETTERLYDEYDRERDYERLMEDENDGPPEVEPEDLDDETIERLYDEYDSERRMKDEHDGFLEEEKAQR